MDRLKEILRIIVFIPVMFACVLLDIVMFLVIFAFAEPSLKFIIWLTDDKTKYRGAWVCYKEVSFTLSLINKIASLKENKK